MKLLPIRSLKRQPITQGVLTVFLLSFWQHSLHATLVQTTPHISTSEVSLEMLTTSSELALTSSKNGVFVPESSDLSHLIVRSHLNTSTPLHTFLFTRVLFSMDAMDTFMGIFLNSEAEQPTTGDTDVAPPTTGDIETARVAEVFRRLGHPIPDNLDQLLSEAGQVKTDEGEMTDAGIGGTSRVSDEGTSGTASGQAENRAVDEIVGEISEVVDGIGEIIDEVSEVVDEMEGRNGADELELVDGIDDEVDELKLVDGIGEFHFGCRLVDQKTGAVMRAGVHPDKQHAELVFLEVTLVNGQETIVMSHIFDNPTAQQSIMTAQSSEIADELGLKGDVAKTFSGFVVGASMFLDRIFGLPELIDSYDESDIPQLLSEDHRLFFKDYLFNFEKAGSPKR